MSAIAHQKIFADFHPETAQTFNLGNKRDRIDHYAVANDADFPAAQNSRGNEMQNVGRAAVNDGVAGVVTALAADNHIGLACQHIDDLALSFVAPLRAN